MALAIRLARGGRKGRPFYRIVVADKRMPRDGRFIEKLGTYNPLLANDDDKRVVLNEERIKHWLSEGAKPSDRVAKFLGKAGLIAVPEIRETPQKSAPGQKAQDRIREKEEKRKEAEEAAKAAEAEKAAAAEAPAEESAPQDAPVEEAKAEDAPAAEAEASAEAPAEAEKPAEEEKKDA